MRLLKVLVVLILAAVIGLAGYAYFGDMQPVRTEVRSPLGLAGTTPAVDPDADTVAGTGDGTAAE